jgi:hypothetical protein
MLLGAAQGCGDALSTSDGGEHWRDTGQLASALSALPGGSALALVSSTSKGAPELALTRDWGARWTQLTPLRDVRTEALLGGARTVSDVTDAGTFMSGDGDERWTAFDPPQLGLHSTLLAAQPDMTASLSTSRDRCALLPSGNGGEQWHTVAPPGGTLKRIVVDEGGGIDDRDQPRQRSLVGDPGVSLQPGMLRRRGLRQRDLGCV